MNFKIKFVALLIVSMFLLSSCEVYQTLYGSGDNTITPPAGAGKVVRADGASAKEEPTASKELFSSASATKHDPFKAGQNPLGPFDKGTALGFNLNQWLSASGKGIYTVSDGNSELDLYFRNLVPDGVYTLLCSRVTFPPNPNIEVMPCGAEDGSENSFTADSKGAGSFSLKMNALDPSTKETASALAIAYHSDGKTYGANPGDFGLNSHVQLFFMIPEPKSNSTAMELPIKFTNHIDAGFPEQDVFLESDEQAPEETANTAEEPGSEATEMPSENTKPVDVKKSDEKPVVVVVQETDSVDLIPKAEDPDKNTVLSFTFTSPISDKGQWQTTYGDAGEYTITVTVSDGELATSRDVLLIVNKKEEAPAIDVAKPIEASLTIDEGQSIEFNVQGSDLNKDPLMYNWKFDGNEAGKEQSYTYQSDFESAGTHTVKVDVSDGLSTASKIWSVNVRNVNRQPVLEHFGDINAKETDKIVITALATDDDKDSISYSISDRRFAQENNVFIWQTDYDSAGSYDVTVSASDGTDTVDQPFKVDVANVNRPPMIVDVLQKK